MDDMEQATSDLAAQVQQYDLTHKTILTPAPIPARRHENGNRRNNIWIRGLPESVEPKDLHAAATTIFNNVLQQSVDTAIEIDRIHRALGPKVQNRPLPRDVICRIPFYAIKDSIMKVASSAEAIMFNESPISLISDLSGQTLQLRRALKPQLEALQEWNIKYRWGFLFQLVTQVNGKTVIFWDLGDLPIFLGTVDLPQIPTWPAFQVVYFWSTYYITMASGLK